MKVKNVLFLLIVISTIWYSATQSTNPGFKTCISQNCISYLKDIGVQILLQKLSTINIPDITGSTDAPVIGTIDYELSAIVLTQLQLPTSSITLDPNTGITVSVIDVSAYITMNWDYKEESWPHIGDSGTADVSVSGTSITVVVSVNEANGRPTVSVDSISVSIGSLDITLHGGASWLYDLFVNIFSGQIKDAVQNELQTVIQNEINDQANQALSTLPIEEIINSWLEIDFALQSNPIFTSTYVTSAHKGEFFDLTRPIEAPFTAVPLPDSITSDMLQMFVTDYLVNSFLFSSCEDGKLHTLITNSEVPADSPIQLNTTSAVWGSIAPGLTKLYPNNLMELCINATTTPRASFSTTGAIIVARGNIMVDVINDDTPVNAFVLNVTVYCSGDAAVSGSNLTAHLNYLYTNISLLSTNIGNVIIDGMSELMNFLITAMLPLVNQKIGEGFVLPTIDGVTLNSPVIGWGAGYLYVSTDITYNPPALKRNSLIN